MLTVPWDCITSKETVEHVYIIYHHLSHLCQLLSAVENPTSTTALKRSPYSTVNQRSLKGHEVPLYHRGDATYPKPSHAKIALVALVITRPQVSIIGRVPEIASDKRRARNALILIVSDDLT